MSKINAQLRARHIALPAIAAIVGLSASSAAASPLTDCFERIAVAARHVTHHHSATPHRAVHRPHPHAHRVAAASPTAAYAYRMRYILRPRACDKHPATALSLLPGATGPQTTQQLLAELAGPTAPPQQAVEGAATPPAAARVTPETSPPVLGFPGAPPVVTPPAIGPGAPSVAGPGTPGGPGTPPPVTPQPGTPPPATPPGPPIVPPGPPDAPPVTPAPKPVVDPPPPRPPVAPPTEGPGGPGGFPPIPPMIATPPIGPSAIPEPATWAMLILGFFGLGAALRRKRSATA